MADDDFEYKDMEEVQEKMTERHAKDAEGTKEDVTVDELDDEPVTIDGGDEGEDFDKGEKTDEVEEEKAEEVKEEEVKEEEVKEEEKKELTQDEQDAIKIKEDVIKHLEGKTTYRIKGKDYDLEDLSPQEITDRFSKAGRFYERMEELAQKERTLVDRERMAEQGARQSQDIMQKYGGKTDEVKVPKALQVNEDDSDTERGLKEIGTELYTAVQGLKQGYQQQTETIGRNVLERDLETLVREFPVASKEEIVAVMCNYPDANIRTVAEKSHTNRTSDQYIDAVLQARPEKLREIEEKAIERHLAKKQQAKKVSRKSSSSTVSSKSSTKKSTAPRTMDAIDDQLDKMRESGEFIFDED